MSNQPGSQERDWRELRLGIRILCYDATEALEQGRGLDNLRPRPLPDDLATARQDLVRVLVKHDWSRRRGPEAQFKYKEIRLYDLLYELCKVGHALGIAWGTILQMLDRGAAKAQVRPRQNPGVTNLDAGEGCVFLATTPEAMNRYLDSIIPEEKPKWDRGFRTLTYKSTRCKTFKRFAEKQFAILDAFEKAGWPNSVKPENFITRQTAEDLNSTMEPDSPIRFSYSESTKLVSWTPKR